MSIAPRGIKVASRVALACLAVAAAAGATAQGAAAAPLTIEGSKLQVFVGENGNLNARIRGSSQYAFTPDSSGGKNAGLMIGFPETAANYEGTPIANTIYGVGPLALQLDPYPGTPVVTGTGTELSPFTVKSRFRARTSSYVEGETLYYDQLEINQTVTHVSGTTEFKVVYSLTNISGNPRNVRPYVIGDLNLGANGIATATYSASPTPTIRSANPSTGASGELRAADSSPFDTPFSSYGAGEFYNLALTAAGGNSFADQIAEDTDAPGNTAIGLDWNDHSADSTELAPTESFTFGAVWRVAEPVQGSIVTAEPGTGTVTVKKPGTTTPVELKPGDSLPVGTVVDATQGTIKLASAGSTPGNPQFAEFTEGRFKIEQAKGSPLTTLRLVGPLEGCAPAGPGIQAHGAGSRKRKGRSLWGSGHGRFRTAGSRGSALIRGTTWRVTDRCDGTTVITSISGLVGALDAKWSNRRPVRYLKSGHSYFAKPKGY